MLYVILNDMPPSKITYKEESINYQLSDRMYGPYQEEQIKMRATVDMIKTSRVRNVTI